MRTACHSFLRFMIGPNSSLPLHAGLPRIVKSNLLSTSSLAFTACRNATSSDSTRRESIVWLSLLVAMRLAPLTRTAIGRNASSRPERLLNN